MELRPATMADLDAIAEIDGTVESLRYLHVDRNGTGTDVRWSVQERPLRERLVLPRPIDEEQRFNLRQTAAGHDDDGVATVAVHDGEPVALLLARREPVVGVLRLLDLRVDFDHRRQGLATAMLFAAVATAREADFRAVAADVPANNGPAHALLAKLDFALAGLDAQRNSNHDLVKEAVTLFWYLALD